MSSCVNHTINPELQHVSVLPTSSEQKNFSPPLNASCFASPFGPSLSQTSQSRCTSVCSLLTGNVFRAKEEKHEDISSFLTHTQTHTCCHGLHLKQQCVCLQQCDSAACLGLSVSHGLAAGSVFICRSPKTPLCQQLCLDTQEELKFNH